MLAEKKTKTEVMAALNHFIDTYARKDLEGTLALLAPDPDLMIIGTGKDERIVGIEAARKLLKQDFEQSGSLSIKLSGTTISSAGSVAWITTDSHWQVTLGKREMSYEWRWTIVMEKRQSKWLLMQSHLSAPERLQADGQSFPS